VSFWLRFLSAIHEYKDRTWLVASDQAEIFMPEENRLLGTLPKDHYVLNRSGDGDASETSTRLAADGGFESQNVI